MKPLFKSKISLWASILALVVIIGVGATLAYLSASDSRLTNTFSLAEVDTEINEDLTSGNKTVTVENVGKSPVYIRARLMVSGIDPTKVQIVSTEPDEKANGTVYLVMPYVTADWDLATGNGANQYTDNFYYYKGVVYGGAEDATPSGKTPTETSALLKKVVIADDLVAQEGFLDKFSVTVYHESVLAQDTTKNTAAAIEDVFESA